MKKDNSSTTNVEKNLIPKSNINFNFNFNSSENITKLKRNITELNEKNFKLKTIISELNEKKLKLKTTIPELINKNHELENNIAKTRKEDYESKILRIRSEPRPQSGRELEIWCNKRQALIIMGELNGEEYNNYGKDCHEVIIKDLIRGTIYSVLFCLFLSVLLGFIHWLCPNF